MSATRLRILSAGPGVTIQDGGRRGFLRFGVTESGPMDRLAHRTANRAAGVPWDSAAIEVSLGGIELAVEGAPLAVALAGGSFNVSLDGRRLPSAVVIRLSADHTLSVRAGDSGAWCYLAVAGRFDRAAELGSVSMHTRTSIGGRPLEAGSVLPVVELKTPDLDAAEIVAPWLERSGENVRVILGPQDDYFNTEQIAAFFEATWVVSHQSDRMGYVLEGPKLSPAKGFNIVSDGTAFGSIQIPGAGRPIVLMADRPPTGGYPKIATVISADIGRLAQLRPGHELRFAASSVEEAVSALRHEMRMLAQPVTLRPLGGSLSAGSLLRQNLVDGVTDGEC